MADATRDLDVRSADSAARPSRTTGLGGPAGSKVRLMPGRMVPGTRYRIVRWLGEGGMGVVYEAAHEDIDRRVALKILKVDAREHPELARLFRDEARAASRIGCPQIVEIYDFGELPDGRLMIAMELVEGHSLADEVARGSMPAQRLLPVLRQVAKGLQTAHAAGIIHCDVKPENILLARKDGRDDAVKLVDFGIARAFSTSTGLEHAAMGTPEFMAPEQCTGDEYDGRLDLYSLGCTAYDLVVGHPPFYGPDITEILSGHLERVPAAPNEILGEDVLPPSVQAVILRALAKDPSDRFDSMADFEAALCEAQIEAGIETAWDDLALPDVEPERIERLTREMPSPDAFLDRVKARRRLFPVLALGAALVVALGAGVLTLAGDEASVVDTGAVDQLMADARKAAASANYVYPPVDQPTGPTAYQKILELERQSESLGQAATEGGSTLRLEFADALARLGDRYWDRPGGRSFATEYYVQALVFAEDEHSRTRAGVLSGELTYLRGKAADGDFTDAEIVASRPLVILADEDESAVARRLGELAARDDQAPGFQRRAIDSMLQRPRRAPVIQAQGPEPSDPLSALANEEAKPATATKDAEAETVRRSKRDPAAARALSKKAAKAIRRGDQAAAEQLYYQALAADNRNGAALMGLSDIHFDRSAHQKAVRFGEKAVAAAPRNAGYRLRLGDAYFKLFRYQDAKKQYEAAMGLGAKDAQRRLDKLAKKLGK